MHEYPHTQCPYTQSFYAQYLLFTQDILSLQILSQEISPLTIPLQEIPSLKILLQKN